jgi:hypothetical protein
MSHSFVCCCCRAEVQGYGNNPAPLIQSVGSRCCDDCNKIVLFIRLNVGRNPNGLNRRNWLHAIRSNDPGLASVRAMFPSGSVLMVQ